MFLKGLPFFLHNFSRHITHKTLIFFIIVESFIGLSETCKSIQHDTLNNVTEKKSKECQIYHIIGKSSNFKLFHCFNNGSRDIKRHNTVQHTLAHFINWFSFTVYIFHVVTEGNSTEDKDKDNTHETNIKETLDVDSNCFKDICKYLYFTEDID